MEDEEGISSQGREFLSVIDRNSERLLRLVGDLLFVAQDDAGLLELDLAPVRPHQLMEDAVASARPAVEARRINLSTQAKNVPDVMGDPGRLSQMLDNLLSNSLKFTPPGGRVEVRLSRDAMGATLFEFRDTGIGTPRWNRIGSSNASSVPTPQLGTSSRERVSASRSSS